MRDLEKTYELIELYEIYEKLLTEKQISYFELYYFDDYSLNEIAGQKEVSKNAIYDSLMKIANTLHKFEDSLQLGYKQKQRDEVYKQFENVIACKEIIKTLKEVDSE